MLGGTHDEIVNALSNAWIDGQSLRTYRHAPNAGSRKSWAAGDATSRGVRLALMALKGEMGYPVRAHRARPGASTTCSSRASRSRSRAAYGSYVMENVLFKISFPAEFHAQTAVECAVALHPHVRDRLEDIEKVVITTHESAIRIIDKRGPLNNPADRDHCIQYMTAIGLMKGTLTAPDYEDEVAKPTRASTRCARRCSAWKTQPGRATISIRSKRSIANAVQVFFKDGTSTPKVAVEYPIGHRRRRKDGIPLLELKFRTNLARRFAPKQQKAILDACSDAKTLETMPVNEFVDLFVV